MNNSIKGALLSGLVFPGLGQVVLKHYKRGIAFIIVGLIIMMVIVVKAVQQALTILEKIDAEGGVISMNTITNAVIQASTPSESLTFKLLLFSLFLCWILGVVDAYRVGKRKDIDEGRIRS
jgi:TM2 domain-containing membrane protein YozV